MTDPAAPTPPAETPARRWLRAGLTVAGAVAIFAAVMRYYEHAEGAAPPAAGAGAWSRTDVTFGWRSSPLVSYRAESARAPQPDGGLTGRRTSGSTVGWVSWSPLSLAVGVGLILAARGLRPRPNPESSKTADDPDPPARPMGKRK